MPGLIPVQSRLIFVSTHANSPDTSPPVRRTFHAGCARTHGITPPPPPPSSLPSSLVAHTGADSSNDASIICSVTQECRAFAPVTKRVFSRPSGCLRWRVWLSPVSPARVNGNDGKSPHSPSLLACLLLTRTYLFGVSSACAFSAWLRPIVARTHPLALFGRARLNCCCAFSRSFGGTKASCFVSGSARDTRREREIQRDAQESRRTKPSQPFSLFICSDARTHTLIIGRSGFPRSMFRDRVTHVRSSFMSASVKMFVIRCARRGCNRRTCVSPPKSSVLMFSCCSRPLVTRSGTPHKNAIFSFFMHICCCTCTAAAQSTAVNDLHAQQSLS